MSKDEGVQWGYKSYRSMRVIAYEDPNRHVDVSKRDWN
jgi:hypothetical protein